MLYILKPCCILTNYVLVDKRFHTAEYIQKSPYDRTLIVFFFVL